MQKTFAKLSSALKSKISMKNSWIWNFNAFSILHVLYILAKFNTFSKSSKPRSKFNTFLIPRGNSAISHRGSLEGDLRVPEITQNGSWQWIFSQVSRDKKKNYPNSGKHRAYWCHQVASNARTQPDRVQQQNGGTTLPLRSRASSA